MNKKILIGSIIASAFLIGVSFTSVVGYQSTSKTIYKTSPLFDVRAKRATEVEYEDFPYDYIGRGESNILGFSKIDHTNRVYFEMIDRIFSMNDKTFESFMNSFNEIISKYYNIKQDEATNLIEILKLIRINPNVAKYYIGSVENIPTESATMNDPRYVPGLCLFLFLNEITAKFDCTMLGYYIPPCFVINILWNLRSIVTTLILILICPFIDTLGPGP